MQLYRPRNLALLLTAFAVMLYILWPEDGDGGGDGPDMLAAHRGPANAQKGHADSTAPSMQETAGTTSPLPRFAIKNPNRDAGTIVPRPIVYSEFFDLRKKHGANFKFDAAALHRKEDRDASWAPSMEGLVRRRFDPQDLSRLGIGGTALDSVDCRSSTCRVEVSFDRKDLEFLRKHGDKDNDPASYVAAQSGTFASLSFREPLKAGDVPVPGTWNVRSLPDGRLGTVYILAFGPEEIDPGRYMDWTAMTHAATSQ